MNSNLSAMKDASSHVGSELKELNDESDPCEDTLRRTNLMKLHLKCAPKNKSSALRLVLEPKKLLDIKQLDSSPCVSPMSQLAANLNGTQISTPTTSRRDFGDSDVAEELPASALETQKQQNHQEPNDEITASICSPDKEATDDNSSLISNRFTLSSSRTRVDRRSSESLRARFAQRRLDDILETSDSNYDENNLFDKHHDEMPIDEVSFYGSHSPRSRSPQPCPPSPIMDIAYLPPEGSPQRFTVVHDTVTIVDNDRLRGDCASFQDGKSSGFQKFHFTEPRLPKLQDEKSPQKMIQHEYKSRVSPKNNFRIFNSLSSTSTESMEDDYMELFDMEALEDVSNFPTNMNTLISGDIKNVKTTPEMKRPVVRRCLSLTDSNEKHRTRNVLFEPKTPEILKKLDENSPRLTLTGERCFKRPEPPSTSPIQSKRYKPDLDEKENSIINSQQFLQEPPRPVLRKSMSLNDAHIMTALARSSSEPDLIGDFSKPFCLPLMDGRHQDLKSISCDTMARLIKGEFADSVASFKIIDCRYPYEFEGGHIRGAHNLYTHDQILEELVNCKTEAPTVQAEGPKRHILVFHCEFSSERGPKLSRFLRSNDRQRNTNAYPALHYPEIYLLHGGYKEFFGKYSELCDPVAYRPMLHPSYVDHYKQCRAKSKSWSGDIKASASANRFMKSRSRLVL